MKWPRKFPLFGVMVSAVTPHEAITTITKCAKMNGMGLATNLAVHGLVTATQNESYKNIINKMDLVMPDGQPVRIALNLLHGTKISHNLRGTDIMLRLCRSSEKENISIYLYGSTSHVVNSLKRNLLSWFPKLNIVGCEPSIFRPLTPEEDKDLIQRINESGARIVFYGLGCPLQEMFAYSHRKTIKAIGIANGAAFDFLSGNKKEAPIWMQKLSLEWLHRLLSEPKRLWKRYLITNTIFLKNLILQITGLKKS